MKYSIKYNIDALLQDIRLQEKKYHRRAHSVQLLAVSKRQPIEKIKAAIEAGQRRFAENYCQEALQKIHALNIPDLEWHFIGRVQRNKTRDIATHFDWVHGVASLIIAKRLNQHRPENLSALNICVQVNISQEETKEGLKVSEVADFLRELQAFSRLRLRGLMVMPRAGLSIQEQIQTFTTIKKLQQSLISDEMSLDTLSMGMSQDYRQAIAAGSTIVRIGTAIFGNREQRQ